MNMTDFLDPHHPMHEETNRVVAHAFDELQALGVPVYKSDRPDMFTISAEENGETIWADYYAETSATLDEFGVHELINGVLSRHELFAEWYDPGTLWVWPI